MNTCFSEGHINELAKRTGFMKRSRKLSPLSFTNALMFSIGNQANTSLTDLTADIYQHFDFDISKEALHKRFNDQAVQFFKELIKTQLSHQFASSYPEGIDTQFPFVKIKDSTRFSLPHFYGGSYPGFGNFSKKNGLMTLQYEYDLASGMWENIEMGNITKNDQQVSKETIGSLQEGGLYIRDLGYISPTYLHAVTEKGAYFLNRLPPQANIYTSEDEEVDWKSIHRKFNKTGVKSMEMNVLIYRGHKIPCRLIIERLTDQQYKNRLERAKNVAKSRNIGISDDHKRRCRYNAFITNIKQETLPIEKIRKTYGLRWQVELVFKTWKSFFEINKLKRIKKERLECQLLAKLLWILLNWQLFMALNNAVRKQNSAKGVSILKFFKRCRSFSYSLREVVLTRIQITLWLRNVFIPQTCNTLCESPVNKHTHYQTLNDFIFKLS